MSDIDDFVIKDDDTSEEETEKKEKKVVIETEVQEPDFKNSPACMLLIGKPKRGKSNAVKYFLLKNLVSGVFKFGLVFTRTKYSKEYEYLPDKYIYSGFETEILENFLRGMEELLVKGKEIPPNFIVFDDLLGLLSKNNPILLNFFACHRHTNTTIFLATQHLKTGSATTLREICTDAIMFNSKHKNTVEALFECFGQLFDNYNDFKNHFFEVSSEPFTAMYYKQDVDKIEDNYARFVAPNLDGYEKKVKFEF